MSLAARLWAASADAADAALAHPFVRGLADGSLPLPAFQVYVAQDAVFLEGFARAYALALARSDDRATLDAFAGLIAGVVDELRLHAAYAERWGVDTTPVRPLPATTAYTDFVLATAALRGVGVTCAALAPCMRLYAHLGTSLDPEAAGPYAEWVRTYADPAFEALARTLEDLLDRHADDVPEVAAAYRRAMELELAFFSAALERSPG
ncbi:MAG: Thiaminase II involved in salvage of thiamin pyrimidine moiety, TenA subgroup with Cys in active site [uncultured Frankineae bacterium]|uniref:Thiaminase II involved in salvage of thiamin pyrimidine moiety, TenA subgroup with Cys in active site n=1 Tax=uncultured Frankineae bacterium TaxID=437475 RepID=A0A6J4LXT3_9ACTN|nr:MAG: Thiaminase II involved in salvage of thiamin pyrimidine moiety, TenA subgroup with Cys in active site [uncultured Frankineae bacterium]